MNYLICLISLRSTVSIRMAKFLLHYVLCDWILLRIQRDQGQGRVPYHFIHLLNIWCCEYCLTFLHFCFFIWKRGKLCFLENIYRENHTLSLVHRCLHGRKHANFIQPDLEKILELALWCDIRAMEGPLQDSPPILFVMS